jgi:glycerol-3-phosphate dehydrogenase
MWGKDSRDNIWSALEHPWDVIVVGGGACGAGIFNYAARAGLRTLLVEANDFAFGASGRSSKKVHGCIQHPRSGRIEICAELGQEREKLLNESPYLVNGVDLFRAAYRGEGTPFGERNPLPARDIQRALPLLKVEGLRGGQRYEGASLDDTQLVLRLIREGVSCGGVALNYARAVQLLFTMQGEVCGVVVNDRAQGEDGRTAEAQARVVINATGAWCDDLRVKARGKPLLRQKIGSHLFLPAERLPLSRSLVVRHPRDGRALFFTPWEGVIVFGATELDYFLPEDVAEPAINAQEVEYLLEGMTHFFPGQELTLRDVIACHAGVYPTAKEDSRLFSRNGNRSPGIILEENGLVSVSANRLGAFRLVAAQALNLLRKRLPGLRPFHADQPVLEAPGEMPYSTTLDPAKWTYLAGRYGHELPRLLPYTPPEELQAIYPQLPALWAELRWAARDGAVVHLDDLLLRRLRLGLLVKRGALTEMEDLRPFIQPELGWDDIRWQWEVMRYSRIHELYYSV